MSVLSSSLHQGFRGRLAAWRWMAAEPYRLFFASGTVWSVAAVLLWPLFYAGRLDFYPAMAHSRLMIEAFGGAFVVGFLGTAGPRMASAPALSWAELAGLFVLHQAVAWCHLRGHAVWGDALFAAMLGGLLAALVVRVMKFRQEPPPPQLLLAVVGLGCGLMGAVLPWVGEGFASPERLRLAGLLLHQGFLLLPVLGIGSFIFPRMLGGDFGEPEGAARRRAAFLKSLAAAVLIIASFFLEAHGSARAGALLRVGVSGAYLLSEIRWRRAPGAPRGSLTTGLVWALGLGALGLALSPLKEGHHVSIAHLLYIGGFGLLMLVVGSRVLFGHSGDLPGFFRRSGWVRVLVFLGVLAAVTRATPAWLPSTTVSHHIYASWTWALLALAWLVWHRRRFLTRDEED